MRSKKIVAFSFAFATLISGYGRLSAQEKKYIPIGRSRLKDTIAAAPADTAYEKDIFDVVKSVFTKAKAKATVDSVTTKPVLSILPAVGYTLQTALAATISGNIAFRTNPAARISTITINPAYTQKRQVIIPLQANIWTKDNQFNLISDLRFYKYPQSSFGLGSNSDIKNENPLVYSFFRFNETVLRNIGGDFFAGLGYIFDDRWNMSEKGQLNGQVSDYERYGPVTRAISTGLTFNLQFDSRDNTINPSRGFYASLNYRDNFKFLGSTTPWRSLIIDVRKYYRFPANSDNVLAFWSYNWLVLNGRPAYLDLPATGHDPNFTTGRGYIQGRFRGTQMVYLESEYRFKLTRNGLVGGVLFLNGQSFSAAPGSALQAVQPGYGPGLRIKLNKVSKTNIAVDYGFGREGSKGLFINVGEVF
ncbi:MAG TPA: BamA/TamA family outer membrane protein [Mucilaginibacter sp.]